MTLNNNFISGLLPAIENYGLLEIADYQRNYSWPVEAVNELFDDMQSLVGQPNQTHFIGSLILLEDEGKVFVVDGQQRLTTLFIFAAAMRDQLMTLGTHKIQAKSELERDIDVLEDVRDFLYLKKTKNPRFASNKLLNEIFTKCIMAEPASQQVLPDRDQPYSLPLRKAARAARELLANEMSQCQSEAEKLELLAEYSEIVSSRLQVLTITSSNLDESLDVFMTLNDRGMPLGPADLVRGYLLQNLTDSKSDKESKQIHKSILASWEEVLKSLTEASADVFLRHHLLSIQKNKVQKKKIREVVSDIVNERIDKPKDSPPVVLTPRQRATNARKFWDEMISAADVYQTITNPPSTKIEHHNDDMLVQLRLLRVLVDSYRVLLLTVFGAGDAIPEVERRKIVRTTFLLVVKWFMAGKNSQVLETDFQNLSTQYRESKDVELIHKGLQTLFTETTVDTDLFFKRADIGTDMAKVLLFWINRQYEFKANKMQWDSKNVHLEHIAPESEIEHWLQLMIDPGSLNPSADYSVEVERLGNKTLLDAKINTTVKQARFELKITDEKGYGPTQVALTRDLTFLDEWHKGLSESRCKWLAEVFDAIWEIEPTKPLPAKFSEWLK